MNVHATLAPPSGARSEHSGCSSEGDAAVAAGRNPAGPEAPKVSLRSLVAANRGPLLLTYGLFNVENGLRLAQPFVLGLAIDGLLRSSYVGLLIFVAQHLAHMLISCFRRMYDTRTFTRIYSELATSLVVAQRRRRVGLSRVAARSALSRSYVEFFERYVPMVIRAGYSIAGALAMLALYDWTLIPFCLALAIPAFLLNAAYGRKTFGLNGRLHDRFEREVEVIGEAAPADVRRHYDEVARWRIRLSDAEAMNFSLMELFVLGAIVASLVHFCTSGAPRPGEIFAVFRYVLMFIMGLDSVPRLVEQVSRLRDIGVRMRAGPE